MANQQTEIKFLQKAFVNDKPLDFILAGVRIPNIDEFCEWAKSQSTDGSLNFDIKRSKAGKLYGEVDDWRPSGQKQTQTQQPKAEANEKVSEDLPF